MSLARSLTVTVHANKDMFAKRFNQRRQKLERVRSLTIRRMTDDLNVTARRELQFTQELFENAFPFNVKWDKAFMDLSPIKFEYKYEDEEDEEFEVVPFVSSKEKDEGMADDGDDGVKASAQ